LEEGLDRVEKVDLLLDSVAAGLTDVEQEQNGSVQVSKGRNSLHFDGVALVQWVVKDTWGVDHLPPSVLVVSMTHKQVLGRECIRLHIYVRIGNIVDEAGLADVGETSDDERAGVGIDLGQSAKMLSDLLEVRERGLQLLDKRA